MQTEEIDALVDDLLRDAAGNFAATFTPLGTQTNANVYMRSFSAPDRRGNTPIAHVVLFGSDWGLGDKLPALIKERTVNAMYALQHGIEHDDALDDAAYAALWQQMRDDHAARVAQMEA